MRYMVIERFKRGPLPVYQRFDERGRQLPEGLRYVDSWIADDLQRCYQLMETDDPRLFDEWMGRWSDLADFEIVPVLSSAEARRRALEEGPEPR